MSVGILDVNVYNVDGRGHMPILSIVFETTEIVVQQNQQYSHGKQMKSASSKRHQ